MHSGFWLQLIAVRSRDLVIAINVDGPNLCAQWEIAPARNRVVFMRGAILLVSSFKNYYFLSLWLSRCPHQLAHFCWNSSSLRCGIPTRHGRYSLNRLPSLACRLDSESSQAESSIVAMYDQRLIFSLRRHLVVRRRRYKTSMKPC